MSLRAKCERVVSQVYGIGLHGTVNGPWSVEKSDEGEEVGKQDFLEGLEKGWWNSGKGL